ncbi:MAG: radical SAM/SPASM domain-containing protein [Campylobacterales bacterium]|nr:radical SAM/SPASM domain-containing protein [Campylobacterales bacterium]
MKFHRIYIEITDICGLSCTFCATKPTNTIMPLELFERITAQAAHFTHEIALHIMGDPLVLSNLKSYLDILERYNLRAFITTSGYYIANHSFETLMHPAIKQINISINSYNKNTNRISFEEYLEPIFGLIEYKLAHQIDTFINLRIWNLDEALSEKAFNQSFFDRVSKHFDVALENIYQTKPKTIRIAFKTLLHFDSYFEWPSLDNPIYGDGRCEGLKSHCGILVDGSVVPCCLDAKGAVNLGNLTKESLEKILYNSKTQTIINGFRQGRAVEELCQKCSYKNRFKE